MEQSFIQKYGPWGVVTGGTRGIGKALAESLASRGLNVAETAIRSLGRKISVIPGIQNNIESFFLSLLPKRFAMKFFDKIFNRFFAIYDTKGS